MDTCVIIRQGKKYDFHMKAVTMIESVTGRLKITQYEDKGVISIMNLVETTWLIRYPRPIEITFVQVSEFIGHEFIKFPIEK